MYIDLHAVFEVGSLSSHVFFAVSTGINHQETVTLFNMVTRAARFPWLPNEQQVPQKPPAKFVLAVHPSSPPRGGICRESVSMYANDITYIYTIYIYIYIQYIFLFNIYIYMHGYDVNLAGGVGVPNGATGMRYVTLGM